MTEDDVFNALKYRIYDPEWEAYMWHNDAGQLHRIDGPAIERIVGSKFWYVNGKLHRTEGPAIEFYDGTKIWYINGEKLTEPEFVEAIKQLTKASN